MDKSTYFRGFAFGAFFGMLLLATALTRAEPPKLQLAPEPQYADFPPKKGVYWILPVSAVDGDTIHFHWLVPERGRLAGINAPELHSANPAEVKAGEAARAFLASKLPTKPVPARVGPDKYGRTLIDVQMGDKTLGEIMVEAGHAKRWDGQGAKP